MIVLLFIVTGIISLLLGNTWFVFVPSVIVIIYCITILPAIFGYLFSRKDFEYQLYNKLSHSWKDAHEIAEYISKYLCAFNAVTSSPKRANDAGTMFIWSLFFAICAFLKDYNSLVIYSYLICAVLVWPIRQRSNWPRYVIESFLQNKLPQDNKCKKELELAATSYVAFLNLNETKDPLMWALVDNLIFRKRELVNIVNSRSKYPT